MTQEFNTLDDANQSRSLKTINVLTILTFIGSGLQLLSGLYTYFTIDKTLSKLQTATSNLDSELGGGKMAEMVKSGIRIMEKTQENKTLIMVITVLGAIACIYGAMEMRKGKLQGLWTYLGGEWAPVIVNLALIGMGAFGGMQLLSLIVPFVFTALYFANKKNLA